MKQYIVRCYDGLNGAKDDGKYHKVEANNMLEAAEKVCGESLTAERRGNQYLRADAKEAKNPGDHNHFYAK